MVDFIHLRVATEYSVVHGTTKIGELFDKCLKSHFPAVGIADDNNLFAAIRFYSLARKRGLKPLIGANVTVIDHVTDEPCKVLLICKDLLGYKNLLKILSECYQTLVSESGQPSIVGVDTKFVFDHAEGLIALSGAGTGDVGKAILSGKIQQATLRANLWKQNFGSDYYIELQRISEGENDHSEELLIARSLEIASKAQIPVVATNAVQFLEKNDYEAHSVRCAIADKELYDGSYESGFTSKQYFRNAEEMKALFSDIPSALENSVSIAIKCSLEMELGKPSLPAFDVPDGESEESYFSSKSMEGLNERLLQLFPEGVDREIKSLYLERLSYETKVIGDMGFAGYFLIVADFIHWSKENGVPIGPGRGSGTGSLVAYCLYITDMDPIQYGLVFERFLNPERISMPDFDVDFCVEGRERTIEYVRHKYGKYAVSQIATFGTMAAKAVVKDVSRVLGKSYFFGDKLAKAIGFELGVKLEDCLVSGHELFDLYHDDDEVKNVIDLSLRLEGVVRSVGKHAGGVVISPTVISDYSPVYSDGSADGVVTMYDKVDVEEAGLVKFDFLGLKNLTVIDKAINHIKQVDNQCTDRTLDKVEDIPLDDDDTFEALSAGHTSAVFQLESQGMTKLVERLAPKRFEDLIPLVALYRPGPLQAGLVDDFIERRKGKQTVKYPHSDLKQILEETYGVIIYQEQIMFIAREMADYSMGMADVLRKAVAKKNPVEMQKQKNVFVGKAHANGYDKELLESLFTTIEHFAAYCFPKAHSATYALIAYQTAYLKVNYASSYLSAVLTCDMGKLDSLPSSFQECSRMGISIRGPNINSSGWEFAPNGLDEIIFGLGGVKGVQSSFAKKIVSERKSNGRYCSLEDFICRLREYIHKGSLENLIKVGAFDEICTNREWLEGNVEKMVSESRRLNQEASSGQSSLLDMRSDFSSQLDSVFTLPESVPGKSFTNLSILANERKLLGMYVSGHPTTLFRELCGLTGAVTIGTLLNEKVTPGQVYSTVGVVRAMFKKQSRRGRTFFSLTVEDFSGIIEKPFFPEDGSMMEPFPPGELVMVSFEGSKPRGYEDNDDLPIRIVSISPCRELVSKMVSSITISLDAKQDCMESFRGGLSNVLANSLPGQTKVFIKYNLENAQCVLCLNDYSIEVTYQLLDEFNLLSSRGTTVVSHINKDINQLP